MQDSKKCYFKVHDAQWNGLDRIFTHTHTCLQRKVDLSHKYSKHCSIQEFWVVMSMLTFYEKWITTAIWQELFWKHGRNHRPLMVFGFIFYPLPSLSFFFSFSLFFFVHRICSENCSHIVWMFVMKKQKNTSITVVEIINPTFLPLTY